MKKLTVATLVAFSLIGTAHAGAFNTGWIQAAMNARPTAGAFDTSWFRDALRAITGEFSQNTGDY